MGAVVVVFHRTAKHGRVAASWCQLTVVSIEPWSLSGVNQAACYLSLHQAEKDTPYSSGTVAGLRFRS